MGPDPLRNAPERMGGLIPESWGGRGLSGIGGRRHRAAAPAGDPVRLPRCSGRVQEPRAPHTCQRSGASPAWLCDHSWRDPATALLGQTWFPSLRVVVNEGGFRVTPARTPDKWLALALVVMTETTERRDEPRRLHRSWAEVRHKTQDVRPWSRLLAGRKHLRNGSSRRRGAALGRGWAVAPPGRRWRPADAGRAQWPR